MLSSVKSCWALFLGLGLMMLGNGLQGTLLGVRAELEGFANFATGIVMSGYFVGFLAGSFIIPKLVNRVGHVRAFGVMAALASTSILLHPVFIDPYSWGFTRVLTGFAYAGLYIICESWVNEASTNETRGQMLSIYMLVILGGLCLSQLLLNVADPGGFELFTLISVLVSVAVIPILSSVSRAPQFDAPTENAPVRMLYSVSPLGVVGLFFAMMGQAMIFNLGGVYAAELGMRVSEISFFMLMQYVGGILLQWPIGRLSDKFDRRLVLMISSFLCAATGLICALFTEADWRLYIAFLVFGGLIQPLYSLCLAHTNDYLNPAQMVAASGTMVLIGGVGALFGPPLAAFAMDAFGTPALMVSSSAAFTMIGVFALWRMTRRASLPLEEQGEYVVMAPVPNAAAINPDVDWEEWNPEGEDHPETMEELFEEFLSDDEDDGEDDDSDDEEHDDSRNKPQRVSPTRR